MTNVRNNKFREERQTVISEDEFQHALKRAEQIKNEFFKLRSLALLSLLRLTGKRRGEIATLKLDNLKVESNFLNITFTLEKKRRGNILHKQAIKSIPLTDPLSRHILNYLMYLNSLNPKPIYFLPRISSAFGKNIMLPDRHISGRQVFNIVRGLSDTMWPHLFRETVASDIIKEDNSIIAAFKVQRRLDLESYQTGFNYLRRFASDIIKREEEKQLNE